MGLTIGAIYRWGPEVFTFIYGKWVGLITSSILMAFAQAIFVYAMSFGSGKLLALGGNTGSFIYDVSRSFLRNDLTSCVFPVFHRPRAQSFRWLSRHQILQ